MKNLWIIVLAFILIVVGAILYFSGQANVLSAGEYAYGYFAAGDFALGVFAAGKFSAGIFSIGIFSIGIFSISVFNIAIYSVGIFVIAYKKRLPKLMLSESEEKENTIQQ
ncbi:MAG: hypothetical protein KAQ75_09260 [Bacteroidales bacterium]|nr:hypothetical protein [Bacteroidales bacterium]